jgi:hypothetical protein
MKDKSTMLKELGFSDTFLSKLKIYDEKNPADDYENVYFVEQVYRTIDSNTLIVKEDQNNSTSFLYIR